MIEAFRASPKGSRFMRGVGVLIACLFLAPAATADVTLRGDGFGVHVESEEKISTARVRLLLESGGKAYRTILGAIGVGRESLFATRTDRPIWATWPQRKEPRIWILAAETVRARDRGAEAYLERMARGELRILVRLPSGEALTPDESHRLWREMAYAILGQTLWRGCPIWLREGVAERFGTLGSEGEHDRMRMLKEQLRDTVDDLDVEGVLTASDFSTWSRRDGRAVSWAMVHLMEETNPELARSLLYRARKMMEHLVYYPSADAVTAESAGIVRALLRQAKLSTADLRSAIQAWVRADFPEGAALRATSVDDLLRRVKLPGGFGVDIVAAFGGRDYQPGAPGTTYTLQTFRGGSAAWRFPWDTSMEAWVGVRARRIGRVSVRSRRPLPGVHAPLKPWEASPAGRKRLEKIVLQLTAQGIKYGFVRVGVTSPRGLGYLYERNFRLK
jgi:hypothetical protein